MVNQRILTAAEAEAWGLVNRVVPDDEVDDAALDLAGRLAGGAAWALGQAKRVIYNGIDHTLETAGEYEAETITAAMASDDGREGIAAFVEKRPPNFA